MLLWVPFLPVISTSLDAILACPTTCTEKPMVTQWGTACRDDEISVHAFLSPCTVSPCDSCRSFSHMLKPAWSRQREVQSPVTKQLRRRLRLCKSRHLCGASDRSSAFIRRDLRLTRIKRLFSAVTLSRRDLTAPESFATVSCALSSPHEGLSRASTDAVHVAAVFRAR